MVAGMLEQEPASAERWCRRADTENISDCERIVRRE